jgi:hypothetical protein
MIDTSVLTLKVLCTTMSLPIAPGVYRKHAQPAHPVPDRSFVRIDAEGFLDLVERRPRYSSIVRTCMRDEVAKGLVSVDGCLD